MSTSRTRRTLTALGSAAIALTLGLTLVGSPAEARPAPGPVHAGSVYGWGKAPTDYRFVGPLKRSDWRVKGPGAVRNQHGMLTLNTRDRGTVSATQRTRGHSVGRWEIRLRSRQYTHGHQRLPGDDRADPRRQAQAALRRAEHRARGLLPRQDHGQPLHPQPP